MRVRGSDALHALKRVVENRSPSSRISKGWLSQVFRLQLVYGLCNVAFCGYARSVHVDGFPTPPMSYGVGLWVMYVVLVLCAMLVGKPSSKLYCYGMIVLSLFILVGWVLIPMRHVERKRMPRDIAIPLVVVHVIGSCVNVLAALYLAKPTRRKLVGKARENAAGKAKKA
mmetsp:Transcript_5307/g.9431  ORF Transcript_5307/g.9431 Transcript_5307/m.9431 type:complete len:170 (-) Transcript_5307:1226-1735(-)